jgi:hypothetical protein
VRGQILKASAGVNKKILENPVRRLRFRQPLMDGVLVAKIILPPK